MKFDKEKCTLFLLKTVSYGINFLIVAAVVGGVVFFVYFLFKGSTEKAKKKLQASVSTERLLDDGLKALNASKLPG